MFVKQFLGEKSGQTLRAEIHQDGDDYSVFYYVKGNLQTRESFAGKSIHFVEDAATNWLDGIKVLNG